MTLKDILGVVDALPDDELDQLEQHILNKKRQNQRLATNIILDEAWALAQIRDILKDVPPTPITYGTMDGARFLAVMKNIHDELSDEDRAEIVRAMNEDYISEDKS